MVRAAWKEGLLFRMPIILVYSINQNTTVIIQALHNLKPQH